MRGVAEGRRDFDWQAAARVGSRLAGRERSRHAAHAAVLRDVLELEGLYQAAGIVEFAATELALTLSGGEWRAEQLLADARQLAVLPGALQALEDGLLGVETSRALVDALAPLDEEVALAVWEQLRLQLGKDAERNAVRPPARLRELVRRLVRRVDPAGVVARRKQARAAGQVDYRQREDGLVDLYAYGITGPNAQACLRAVAARSAPVGPDDERPAGQRRVDALVDLLLGRQRPEAAAGACRASAGGGCGCTTGVAVPCGADVQVLLPLGAALGVTDEVAELVGGGPLDAGLLQELLLAAPALRPVWVDQHGVPVAVGQRAQRPRPGDDQDVRRVLLAMASQPPPGRLHPRHPDDHPPPRDEPAGEPTQPDPPTAGEREHADDRPPPDDPAARGARADRRSSLPRVLRGAHPPGTPGPYRVPADLHRLLTVRSARCEWPGCGRRAVRCDIDHDVPWPAGPTCACNTGPACRRHHRIKHTGWTKTRVGDGSVRWTDPAGRTVTSPSTCQPPEPPVRPLAPLSAVDPWELLSPTEWEHERWRTTQQTRCSTTWATRSSATTPTRPTTSTPFSAPSPAAPPPGAWT